MNDLFQQGLSWGVHDSETAYPINQRKLGKPQHC